MLFAEKHAAVDYLYMQFIFVIIPFKKNKIRNYVFT